MTHHHLAFELLYRLKSNADKNYDRRTAERDRNALRMTESLCDSRRDLRIENRVKSYDAQKECAQKGDL